MLEDLACFSLFDSVMPPQKPVPTLRSTAHDHVLHTVCQFILQELFFNGSDGKWESLGHPSLTPRLQKLRDYLSRSLHPCLLQDLLNSVLEQDDGVEATVRFTAIQLLLVTGVECLYVGHFPEPFYAPVLSAIADSAAMLKVLDLRGVWVRDMHKFYLSKAIRRLHTIRHLTLRYSCDDDILNIIGKNCPRLQKLDIAGSGNITATGLKHLYGCYIRDKFEGFRDLIHTIKVVDLGGPGAQNLPVSQAALLLKYMPNLTSLGSYERTGAAVETLYESDRGISFQLVYMRDLYTTGVRMEALKQTCPEIEALYLDCPKSSAIKQVHYLKKLRHLKLHKLRWCDVEFTITNLKNYLRTLYMSQIFGEINMHLLSESCSYLEKLELHGTPIILNQPEPGEVAYVDIKFPYLRELLIYRASLSSFMVRKLLTSSDVFHHIAFGQCNWITDSEMVHCLEQSCLTNVKEFWLAQARHLSMQSLQSVLQNCPALTSLGNIAGWSIHPGETAFVKLQLALTNTDLTIHDYGPDRDEESLLVLNINGRDDDYD